MRMLGRALKFYHGEAASIAGVIALILVTTGVNLLKPWPLALIVDSVLGTSPLPVVVTRVIGSDGRAGQLVFLCGLIFLLHGLHGGLAAYHQFLSIRIGLRGLTRVRNRLFEALQRLSLRAAQRK